jgi:hypothetical protein
MMSVLGENYQDDIIYHEKNEVCGHVRYNCTLCDFSSPEERHVFEHVKEEHVKTYCKREQASTRRLPFRASWHRIFPLWAGTNVTDYQLRKFCFNIAKDRFNPLSVKVLRVDCYETGLSRLYCPICCFESEVDLELQKLHYFNQHLKFIKRTICTRMFCCT